MGGDDTFIGWQTIEKNMKTSGNNGGIGKFFLFLSILPLLEVRGNKYIIEQIGCYSPKGRTLME